MREKTLWNLIALLDWQETGDEDAVIEPVLKALATKRWHRGAPRRGPIRHGVASRRPPSRCRNPHACRLPSRPFLDVEMVVDYGQASSHALRTGPLRQPVGARR